MNEIKIISYVPFSLDVSNIAAGTTKDQVQKMFKTGKIIKFEPNPVYVKYFCLLIEIIYNSV